MHALSLYIEREARSRFHLLFMGMFSRLLPEQESLLGIRIGGRERRIPYLRYVVSSAGDTPFPPPDGTGFPSLLLLSTPSS